MPAVYTKEEADKLFADIKALIAQSRSEINADIAAIKVNIDVKFNELFGLYHSCNNKLNKLDQDFKEVEKQSKTSNKVRFEHASGRT